VNGPRSRERGQGKLARARREDLLPQELLASQQGQASAGRPTAAHGVKALRAALVTPLSGPLALYGTAGAAALSVWAKHAAGLPSPSTRVELEVLDAHPAPAAAMRAAVSRRPDVLFGPYGSGPAVAALGATDRPVWNQGGATDRLSRPRFAHALNVPAPASSYFAAVLQAVHAADPAARTVALLHAATGFGREVARGASATAEELRLTLQVLAFAPGQAAQQAGQLPPADVLLVAGSFADELTAARLLLGGPWRAAAFVGAGVEEVLAPLGHTREGLLGPCQWLAHAAPTPDEGPDAAWLTRAFRAATGGEPPYPAAAAFAAGVLCARSLREAGTDDDEALLAAAQRLSVTTLFGRFRLDPLSGLQAAHQVLVVQWQQGRRWVIWPPERAERSLVLRQ
jgi:branched-chain amino acid transport system substrate-binding protein